jgi:S1-C subfamily serine protease
MYLDGQGVPQDYAEALKWLRKAIEKGNASAQAILGMMYWYGDGVPQGYAEAVKWYRNAAEQGDALAQNNLGEAYAYGKGVPQDYSEAYKWFNLAASKGYQSALAARNNLASKMSPDQIADGQLRAIAFIPLTSSPAQIQSQTPAIKAERPVIPPAIQPDPRQEIQPSVQASGTGFFITVDGYMLTNFHVVDKASRLAVKVKQETYEAKVITTDAVNDIALLKVSGKFSVLPIASSRTVKLGDSIFTIGYPNPEIQGVEAKLTRGEINSLAGIQDDPRHFQISVPVQPGNSGGPLVDQAGNVVGIVSARLNDMKALSATGSLPQNVNYAVKSSFVIAFLETVPDVMAKLLASFPGNETEYEKVIRKAQDATALILVLGDNGSTNAPNDISEIAASINQKNYLKVERLSKAVLENDPENVAALFSLGVSLYRMDRSNEALSVLQKGGYAAPKDQNIYSCWSGRVLGLCYFSNWLKTKSPSDFREASKWLRSTQTCSNNFEDTRSGVSVAQNSMGQFAFSSLSEFVSDQKQALARLSDIRGTWLSVNSDGTVSRAEHKIVQNGSTFTLSYYYAIPGSKELGGYYEDKATLIANGSSYNGYGTYKMLIVDMSGGDQCNVDYEISLELSEDMQYLVGTKKVLKASGRSKNSCNSFLNPTMQFMRK